MNAEHGELLHVFILASLPFNLNKDLGCHIRGSEHRFHLLFGDVRQLVRLDEVRIKDPFYPVLPPDSVLECDLHGVADHNPAEREVLEAAAMPACDLFSDDNLVPVVFAQILARNHHLGDCAHQNLAIGIDRAHSPCTALLLVCDG